MGPVLFEEDVVVFTLEIAEDVLIWIVVVGVVETIAVAGDFCVTSVVYVGLLVVATVVVGAVVVFLVFSAEVVGSVLLEEDVVSQLIVYEGMAVWIVVVLGSVVTVPVADVSCVVTALVGGGLLIFVATVRY